MTTNLLSMDDLIETTAAALCESGYSRDDVLDLATRGDVLPPDDVAVARLLMQVARCMTTIERVE